MTIVAFDSGDFKRWKQVNGKKKTIFFTPLGIGVIVKEGKENEFKKIYHSSCKKLAEEFQLPLKRPVYSHRSLWKSVGHTKAIPFCDKIITELQTTIEYVFCSFVILPPKEVSKISVGGYGCPLDELDTMDFLRKLSPMFSYITAWGHSGSHRMEEYDYLIDHFASKQTTAWSDLTNNRTPRIFPNGDDCNEFISVADMIAYLTEKKLWDKKLWLEPNNVKEAWKDYDFYVETRFLDKNVKSKIRWFSKQHISVENYLARPMVFLDMEGISISNLGGEPIASAATYACAQGGAFKSFDRHIDSQKIKDRDIYVYAGRKAKKRANTFKDIFDIEIFSFKKLRKKTKELLT